MESTFESAKNHEIFQQVLDSLIINQFCTDYELNEHFQDISIKDLTKAGWLASILADSTDEKHQFLAASFAKLLYLQNSTDEQKSQLAYTILSRTGNLAATNHLTKVFRASKKKFKRSFGAALDLELGTKRNINRIDLQSGPSFVTDFQRELWNALKIHDHIAISAPTSAGKSFFVQHFISTLFSSKEEFKVIYIVPTKALISQISDDFKQLFRNFDNVSIKTAYIDSVTSSLGTTDSVKIPEKKIIYCVTPERCLKLLQEGWERKFQPDLIFIDEIQNVESNDNRAVLLEYVLGTINKLWARSKIIFAGPFINNGPELYKKLLSIPAQDISTYLPPVYQLRLSLQIHEANKLSVIVYLRGGKSHEIKLNQIIELESSASKSMLAPIVKLFGRSDGNLIYAARTDWCVSYAIEFIKSLNSSGVKPKLNELSSEMRDLIDLIKDDIHPDYALVYCLRYKVAFHHGKLPDIVKNEIEYLFKKGTIEYLFCTSTLLQGVNLPAPRMFIISPTKETQKLSQFEFGNLIGRAGRIRNSMIGTIFCLEKHWKEKPWSIDYYNSEYTKNVVPTSEKILKNDVSEIILTLNREPKFLKHTGDEYTLNLIKQKFLESPEAATIFLESKSIEKEKKNAIVASIEAQLKDIKIKTEVARLNPTIDPFLQNKFRNQIIEDGIEKWVLHDDMNQDFNKVMSREMAENLPYEVKPMYYQLESLCERMNNIFAIWKEASTKKSNVKSIRQMIFHGMNWINGLSLAQLIQKELDYEKNSLTDLTGEARILKINEHINKVINVNSIIVTFILVKYFKLLADVLENLLNEEQKEKYKRTLLIPTMLELGSRKVDVIIMISMGIPRSISIKLSPFIPESYKIKPIEWLRDVKSISSLPIKSFYVKYLVRKGYLPSLERKHIKD